MKPNSLSMAGNGCKTEVFEIGYRQSLDGLRGLSILAVMAFNAHYSFAMGGFIGVDLFFVLSGFLITSLLVQEYRQTSRISFKNFYYRRALRLLPALFSVMLFALAYAALFQSSEKALTTLKSVFYTLFYVGNWAQISTMASIGTFSHAWSLSVEEQFYLIWPILLIVLLKVRQKRWIFGALLIAAAASVAWSSWLWHHQPNYLRMYLGSDTRANEILIGCMAAFLVNWKVFPQTKRARACCHAISGLSFAAILYAIFAVGYRSGFVYNGGFTLISLGTAAIIIDITVFPSRLWRFFETQPLVWIGKVSYALFLWHFPIFEALRPRLEGRMNSFIYEALRFGLVFLVAAASFHFLEKPFLKLKRRYSVETANGRDSSVKSSPAQPLELADLILVTETANRNPGPLST